MLKVYLLDDEQNAIDGLKAMLQKKFEGIVAIVGFSCNVNKALDDIENTEIDVLFLDVEMPMMNGIEVLKQFPTRKFQVIFTTAYEGYAISAIKMDAVDYLLKPLAPSDVHGAIKRCLERKRSQDESYKSGKITLSLSGEMKIIDVKDIIRVEADNNYSIFYFTNKSKLIVSKTLKEYEQLLAPYNFYRIHQSHLINTAYVSGIQSSEGDYVLLSNNETFELSRRRKPDFISYLKGINK
jgi:two-component system LytT family response regulator